MRRALLSGLALASAIGLVVACSDESPLGPGADRDGGSPGDGPSQGNEDPPDASDYDGAIAPNGCRLETTGFRAGTKAVNLARADAAGAPAWKNVDDALSDDGKSASVTLDDGDESAELRISGFGFDLPETFETWGIGVELKRQAPQGGVEDARITLVIDGVEANKIDWKYIDGPWPTKIVGTHEYGQAVDTWKLDLYPRHVNTPTFAARLWVRRRDDAPAGPVTALVEAMRVAIYYCRK